MRILFLADLHGNWPATQAIEAILPQLQADQVWFLGDAVGKGPSSPRTLDWVRSHCDHFIGGNWDLGLGRKEYPADTFYWQQLGEERLAWLASLPTEAELHMSGLTLRLVHGRPVTPLLQCYSESEQLEAALEANGKHYDGLVFADSHRPFFRTVNGGYVMNTGSVGNSFGMARAHCLMLQGGQGLPLMSTIISVPYDREQAIRDAEACPQLPRQECWIRQLTTARYSR